MKRLQRNYGFTLVEMLLALLVSGIILAAVATLAYAMGSANDLTDDTNSKEAQVRYTTMYLRELIRNAKLVAGQPPYQLAIWRADDNNDLQVDSDEIVYIVTSTTRTTLKLFQYDHGYTLPTLPPSVPTNINNGIIGGYLNSHFPPQETLLLNDASNVTFTVDKPAAVATSEIVTIAFDIPINGVTRHYEVTASLESPAWNLLSSTNTLSPKGNCGW
jgi:prepilin-type N-terminal cleavage/methylation domain-containing protein